ncbi:MAG: hypothetical protein NTW17_01575 [Candidatus Pacearchaeota archaeon]|nr:hypothetical protein [Candidatus Pacearchaeota archaeon]
MVMTFKYKLTKRPDGSTVKTPSIPLIISGKTESFQIVALIDSGADVSVISKDMAELLGININKEPRKSFGIGGAVNSIESNLNIVIEKGHEKYSLNIPVLVILDEYSFPPLLGRQGFFDYFKITFEQKSQRVLLKKFGESTF